MIYFCSPNFRELKCWPVRLGVRTPGFHPGSRGSNPLRATNFIYTEEFKMAHHQSAKKRIRQDEVKRTNNKFFAKTMRNALRKLRETTDKEAAAADYPKVASMIDRLAKRNIIHKNKAANLKSKLAAQISKL